MFWKQLELHFLCPDGSWVIFTLVERKIISAKDDMKKGCFLKNFQNHQSRTISDSDAQKNIVTVHKTRLEEQPGSCSPTNSHNQWWASLFTRVKSCEYIRKCC